MPTGLRIPVYTLWDKRDIVQTFGPGNTGQIRGGTYCERVVYRGGDAELVFEDMTRSWYLVWYLVFYLFHFVFFFSSGASCLAVATRNWCLRT
jgi:hypothetical protein